ncbi:MAG: hypothetical protein L6R38_005185 [Xanthoria sp. 2 TBL-2021]|nr:MAG: hypothetical protein L6R38_005185 [Xanthoria sp. 2 TBL-2021]
MAPVAEPDGTASQEEVARADFHRDDKVAISKFLQVFKDRQDLVDLVLLIDSQPEVIISTAGHLDGRGAHLALASELKGLSTRASGWLIENSLLRTEYRSLPPEKTGEVVVDGHE